MNELVVPLVSVLAVYWLISLFRKSKDEDYQVFDERDKEAFSKAEKVRLQLEDVKKQVNPPPPKDYSVTVTGTLPKKDP